MWLLFARGVRGEWVDVVRFVGLGRWDAVDGWQTLGWGCLFGTAEGAGFGDLLRLWRWRLPGWAAVIVRLPDMAYRNRMVQQAGMEHQARIGFVPNCWHGVRLA
jgi:hypothetical protein